MKRTIIAAAVLFALILSVSIFTDIASADTSSPQDRIIVELNNERVQNAFVNICDGVSGYTDSQGIFYPGNISSTNQVVANWSTYGKSRVFAFTSGSDDVLMQMVSGNVGCDNGDGK